MLAKLFLKQLNFSGSNGSGTMKICSRWGWFGPVGVGRGAKSMGIIDMSFRSFFNMMVCCVFSLESPHRGDSNEYKQYIIFSIKKENHPK